MNRVLLAAVVALALLMPTLVNAHTQVTACGGIQANHDNGVRDDSVLSAADEQRIERFLQATDALPGVAIAVVKNGEIAYARGFGFHNLANCAKATADTRYYLKSTTKTMLGIAAAVLHEEGTIELDAPIGEYLPGLMFPEGLSAQQTSIRAHLTHTHPYYDEALSYRTAFSGNLAEADFVAHVNEFATPRDIRYSYSNFGPIMAAHAIGAKTESNWRNLIREKVFEPLDMRNSFTVMAEAEKGELATGYLGAQNDKFEATLTKQDSQMHAAGGAVSTVNDLARMAISLLNDGMVDGQQKISKRAIEQVKARQVQLSATLLDYERFAYGLGLYSATYDGDIAMHHFGGETHFSFMPEHGLGVIVLTNELSFGVRVTHHLASSIYDLLLPKETTAANFEARTAGVLRDKERMRQMLGMFTERLQSQLPDGEQTIAVADIAGTYSNARLGDLTIIDNDGELQVSFGPQEGPLTHLKGDAWLGNFTLWAGRPEVFMFHNDKDEVVMHWDDDIFTRLADK